MSRHAHARGRALDRIGWVVLAVAVAVVVALLVTDPRGRASAPGDDAAELTAREIPSAPTGAPDRGMYVDSTVQDDGDVVVAHWINADQPVDEVQLKAADPDDLPGGIVARKVVVVGDGVVLSRRAEVGTKLQTLALKRPASRLYVTYVLTGAMGEAGSVDGRVLARSVALDVAYAAETGPVLRHVSGPGTVLNVSCVGPDDDGLTPRPCGRADGDGWLVEQRGARRDDRLMVQLET